MVKWYSFTRLVLPLLLSAASTGLSPGAYAKMPSRTIKNITRFFKPGMEFYSPTLGETALEVGLIHDLRFLGNVKKAPEPINDKALDDISTLVKIFFPSPAGHLAAETTAEDNFGKHIKDPKTVAYLINFAKDARASLGTAQLLLEKKKIEEKKQQVILSQLKGLPQETYKAKLELKKKRNELPALKKKLKEVNQKLKNEALAAQENLQVERDALQSSIEKIQIDILIFTEELSKKNKNKKKLAMEMKTAMAQLDEKIAENEKNFKKLQDSAFNNIRKSLSLEEKKTSVNSTIKRILTSIAGSLLEEKKAFYPLHTTEQIITAFFCEKFDTQQEILDLLKYLDEDIVDKNKPLPNKENYLDEKDLDIITNKKEAYDYDDVFALGNSSIFSTVPYKQGDSFVSHGNTYPYDREKDEIIKINTFADCVEKAGLHMINLLLFNAENKTFDLSPLKSHIKAENPYFKNFEEFYNVQTPNLANAGDIEMRSLWNKVVGDLNGDNFTPSIQYRYGTFNIKSGLVNYIKIFQKIFNLSIEDVPQKNFAAKQRWLETSLKTLFSTVNDKYFYKLNFFNLQESGEELYGDVSIKVSDKGGTDLFSFELTVKDFHTYLSALKILKKGDEKNYSFNLQTHSHNLRDGQTDESLWLLENRLNTKAHHPLYKIFNTSLVDNDSRINALKTIQENFNVWKNKFSSKNLMTFKRIFGNILNDISWNYIDNIQAVTPLLKEIGKNDDLRNTLREAVRGWDASQVTFNELQEVANNFPNLEYILFPRNEDNFNFSPAFKNLKELDLSSTAVKSITGLQYLTNLEGLNLCDVRHLKAPLELRSFGKLKRLNLDYSDVRIDNAQFNNLSNLEYLNLRGMNQLRDSFSLKNLDNLKSIQLSGSYLQKIDFENLPKLEELNLEASLYLKEVSLKNLINAKKFNFNDIDSLERIFLDNLNISTLTDLNIGNKNRFSEIDIRNCEDLKEVKLQNSIKNILLENIPQMEELDLSRIKNLEFASLKNLNNLKKLQVNTSGKTTTPFKLALKEVENLEELNLMDSSITELTLGHAPHLTGLNLHGSNNLSKVTFVGALNELKELSLYKLNITELSGLGHLSKLEDLNLNSTSNLSEITFEESLEKLTNLSANTSGITKLTGLDHLSKLEQLSLRNTKKLFDINLSGLTQVKKVYFSKSAIQKLDGIDDLENLKELDLSDAKQITSLKVGKNNKDLVLRLKGSGIKKSSDIEGFEHLNLKNVSF